MYSDPLYINKYGKPTLKNIFEDFWKNDSKPTPELEPVTTSPGFDINLFLHNFDFSSFYHDFFESNDNFRTKVRTTLFIIEFMKEHLPSDILPKSRDEFNSKNVNTPFHQFLDKFFLSLPPMDSVEIEKYVKLQTAIDTYVKFHISGKLNNTVQFTQQFNKDFVLNLENAKKLFN